MTRKKPIKPTVKQLIIIKQYWQKLKEAESEFIEKVMGIETDMETATGIKDIEFFMADNEYVGVGNADRTIDLIYLN